MSQSTCFRTMLATTSLAFLPLLAFAQAVPAQDNTQAPSWRCLTNNRGSCSTAPSARSAAPSKAAPAPAASAIAVDAGNGVKAIPLKDGATVHVLKGGKMGMEDQYGRAVRMKDGHVMETKDGQKLIMIGDEVARVDLIRTPPGGRQ